MRVSAWPACLPSAQGDTDAWEPLCGWWELNPGPFVESTASAHLLSVSCLFYCSVWACLGVSGCGFAHIRASLAESGRGPLIGAGVTDGCKSPNVSSGNLSFSKSSACS